MTAEELAQLFHETYEELAPNYGYSTRKSSAVAWKDVPEPNKSLMIAVAEKILEKLEGWKLVERYCHSFKDNDFRLVFKRNDQVLEVSITKEVYDSFSSN